jgi:DNA-binding CsgD family transcriptional regulator
MPVADRKRRQQEEKQAHDDLFKELNMNSTSSLSLIKRIRQAIEVIRARRVFNPSTDVTLTETEVQTLTSQSITLADAKCLMLNAATLLHHLRQSNTELQDIVSTPSVQTSAQNTGVYETRIERILRQMRSTK